MYYTHCFFDSVLSIVMDCFLFNVLDVFGSNYDSIVVFLTSKINKALVYFLPFIIAGIIYSVHLYYWGQWTIKLVPILDKVLGSKANSTPVYTICHPIHCQCCLLNPGISYLHLQKGIYKCRWS